MDQIYQIGNCLKPVENPAMVQVLNKALIKQHLLVTQTFKGLEMIFTGKANFKTDVGGPVTIIKMSAEAAKAGIWNH